MEPKRIKKIGYRYKLPENTVSVTRPSRWANPFKLCDYERGESIRLYKEYIQEKIASGKLDISELKGKNLACFCNLDEDCHADILMKLAAE